MNREDILLVISICCLVLSAALLLYWQLRIRNTYRQLNDLLDDAIAGQFKEKKYDESLMSKVSVKLRRFLISSQLSYHKINQEKEAIKALVSDISHQTKTPITNVLLYLQLLSENDELTIESREQLELIKKQSEKLDFLIQALVKTSRLEIGIIAVKPMKGLLNRIIVSALEQVKSKADLKNIDLKLKMDREFWAFFDYKWTTEAIYNVLDNAIKYTGQGGSVTIALQEYELFVRLDIQDTGMGIPEDEWNKIFQRFYRGRETESQEGVGIGLYLTRRILTEEGGYIKVSSKPGEGSVFSIYISRTSID